MNGDAMRIDYKKTIVRIRAQLGLSQQGLADLLDVTFQTVNRWENGHFEPTKIVKAKLENLMNENGIKPVLEEE